MAAGFGASSWIWLPVSVTLTLSGFTSGCSNNGSSGADRHFVPEIVDRKGPTDPWGKGVGDINGDGRPDLIVGGRNGGGLVWYENGGWTKHVINGEGAFSTDHEVGDVDGDGRNDVVSLMYERLVWFRNRGNDVWTMSEIEGQRLHDLEIGDLDQDGRLDVVGRGQSLFAGGGDRIFLFYQATDGWDRKVIEVPAGEGLKVADLDRDGFPDLVVQGLWLKNPGSRVGPWASVRFSATWTWPHAFIDAGDVNGDGHADIVMAPSEPAGQRYRISWFESPGTPAHDWAEHVIDADIETAHHYVGVADFDRDGRADVATALMHQAEGPAEIAVYINLGFGEAWKKRLVATSGSHNMRILDADGDGDPDLFGANWSGPHQSVELWVNTTCSPGVGCPCWRRHQIDASRPGKATFIQVADLDGDGFSDIATGRFWYRNPRRIGGSWERLPVGTQANDVIILADFDGDGDTDALGTQWTEEEPDPRFFYAANNGRGEFSVRTDLPSGAGDFVQGRALGSFATGSRLQLAVSWHAGDRGIELLTLPLRPATDAWQVQRIFPLSQDEALSAGDIDRDGRTDLLMGTVWLRNGMHGWYALAIDPGTTKPDRNRLADINSDGCLDAVVGFEAISSPGDVVWYEQGVDGESAWQRHRVGSVIGPMSLDVADFDGDGDSDIVVGEHNLRQPEAARLLFFENRDGRGGKWQENTIHTGDEHHDGAVASDIDGDGDMDVLSIGWGHGKVLLYENLRSACYQP